MAERTPDADAASGSIEQHLAALGAEWEQLPETALRACVERFAEAAQPLRALLDRAAAGKPLLEVESRRFFRGLYVLAAARDTESCASLLRLLRRPDEEVDDLLGDSVTESLPRLLSSMFDGDVDALIDVIVDPKVDGFVRGGVLEAATYLAWRGDIDRARFSLFLTDFHRARSAADKSYVWYAWMMAVAHLALGDLVPLVEAAWKGGLIDKTILEWSDFKTDLARARTAYDEASRFPAATYGVVDDVVAELEWTRRGATGNEAGDASASAWEASSSMPAINPYRNVGRNDPCPCGSGKKAKKCCLATV